MEEKTQSVDPAALSAAIVAGAVAVFMTPGPYGWSSLIISLTLVFVIIGYAMSNSRTKKQSLAISSVLAFSSLPGIGLGLELCLGGGSLTGVKCGVEAYCSRVSDIYLLSAWISVLVLIYVFDRYQTNEKR